MISFPLLHSYYPYMYSFFDCGYTLITCHCSHCTRLLEGQVVILPEEELPPHPYGIFACPSHIRASCHATQLVARTPECTLHTRMQLEQCRNRIQVRRVDACMVCHTIGLLISVRIIITNPVYYYITVSHLLLISRSRVWRPF